MLKQTPGEVGSEIDFLEKQNVNLSPYDVNKNILNTSFDIYSKTCDILQHNKKQFSEKITERFSGFKNQEDFEIAAKTFGDLEHSHGGNRLYIKSKILDALNNGKKFTYVSYDLNGMSFSNNLSKQLGNLRILELAEISHQAVKYLQKLGFKETFFSRNGGDEFSLFSDAPDYIVKNALEYGRSKEIGKLKEVLNTEEYKKILEEVARTKGGSNEEELLSKISGFTAGINSYDFSGTKNLSAEDIYKKITTSTDESMEHYKSGRLESEYKKGITELVKSFDLENEKKEEILKIIKKISIKRNYQEKESTKILKIKRRKNKNGKFQYKNKEIKNKFFDKKDLTEESVKIKELGLDKDIESKIIEKIEGFFSGEDKIVMGNYTGKFKTEKENANEILNFIENNNLSEEQNNIFKNIGNILEKDIKNDFYKKTKLRNEICKNLKEKEIEKLDYILGQSKFTEVEISKIKNITNLEEEKIIELKREFIKNLFEKGHYTGGAQPQIQKEIVEGKIEGFSIKNKIVIDTPFFKSINEISGHTNGDYFLMYSVKNLKQILEKILKERGINNFSENVIFVSKGPHTEFFIKDEIIEKNPEITEIFKENIKKAKILEDFNKIIGKDNNGKDLLDKRVDFIKENQKAKFFDIQKEIILLEMGKKSHEITQDEINKIEISEYKKIHIEKIKKEYEDQGAKFNNKKEQIIRDELGRFLEEKTKEELRKRIEKMEIIK